MKSASWVYTPLEIRQMSFISGVYTDCQIIKGSPNTAADTLSGIMNFSCCNTTTRAVDLSPLAQAQESDMQPTALCASPGRPFFDELVLPTCQEKIICDGLTGNIRPFVTLGFRRQMFEALRNICHPGIRARQRLVLRRFVRSEASKDVRNWTRTCVTCQKSKIQCHTAATFSTLPYPDLRFDKIHIDIVDPLTPSSEYTYLHPCVDRLTRWPEALSIPHIRADTIARTLVDG